MHKKNYIIPYYKNIIRVEGPWEAHTYLTAKSGISVVVYHPKDFVVTEKSVASYLCGQERAKMIVQAHTIIGAIHEFMTCDAVRAGAVTMDNSESSPIEEYVGCQHICTKNGISCKQFDDEWTEPDSFMFCTLSGLSDPHDSCPIFRQTEDHEVVQRFGYWVKKPIDMPVRAIAMKPEHGSVSAVLGVTGGIEPPLSGDRYKREIKTTPKWQFKLKKNKDE